MFTARLIKWHQSENDRMMPWKGEKDPYKIWISEIILQQTRVVQGLSYYNNFIEKFPTIENLALAADEDVFKVWEGLGYYSRCRNVLITARNIQNNLNGKFPSNFHDLLQLKGVGPYTAAAIASFAFDQPHAVVDGNVSRVLARYFGNYLPIDSSAGKKYFDLLAQELLYKKNPGLYNQAIMDFGATVCKPQNPSCEGCVMRKSCVAFKTGTTGLLPVKAKKLTKKTRWFTYFIFICGDSILVNKRSKKDIWKDLFEFYLFETDNTFKASPAKIRKWMEDQLGIRRYELMDISPVFKQTLTHQHLVGNFVQIKLSNIPLSLSEMTVVRMTEILSLSFPKFINQYLEMYPL